ncbi:MAG TPA: acylphosphatase [Myxococcota bacterium]|nr:acylphosphatase [Myxococcota bacterium]
MNISKHCVISGDVQGVFYRQGTLAKARSLGLNGWVRNLANGDVECLVSGEKDKVIELCQWLKIGPPRARVLSVVVKDIPFENHQNFVIRD